MEAEAVGAFLELVDLLEAARFWSRYAPVS